MEDSKKTALSATIMILLFAGEIAVLSYFGSGPWYSRAGLVFQIMTVYGLTLGFVQKVDLLKKLFQSDDLTSPHPHKFTRGNALLWVTLFSFVAVANSPRGSNHENTALSALGSLLAVALLPVLLLHCAVYVVVICPIAYVGNIFSSALVETIIGAGSDIELERKDPDGKVSKLTVKEIVETNREVAKGFFLALSAGLLALMTQVIDKF